MADELLSITRLSASLPIVAPNMSATTVALTSGPGRICFAGPLQMTRQGCRASAAFGQIRLSQMRPAAVMPRRAPASRGSRVFHR